MTDATRGGLDGAALDMWLAQRANAPGLYDVPTIWRVSGVQLDVHTLQARLTRAASAWPGLVAQVLLEEGGPVLRKSEKQLRLIAEDLPTSSKDARSTDRAYREALRPLNIETGPMARVSLFRYTDSVADIVVNVHHIVAGESGPPAIVRALLGDEEVLELIETANEGLPRLRRATRTMLGASSGVEQVANRRTNAFEANRLTDIIGRKDRDLLVDAAAAAGVTVYAFVVAAFQIALTATSMPAAVAVAAQPPLLEQVQYSGHLVHLSRMPSTPGTFAGFAADVMRTLLGQRVGGPFTSTGVLEPFAVLANSRKLETWSTPKMNVVEIPTPFSGLAQFPVTLYSRWESDGYVLDLDFQRESVDVHEAERLLSAFRLILRCVVEKPATDLGAVRLVPASRSLLKGHDTADGGIEVVERVRHWARFSPEAAAVSDGVESLTYGELWAHSNAQASRLRAAGVRSGDLVGIAMSRGCQQIVAMLGVFVAGAAYVPLDPDFPSERLNYLLRDAEPKGGTWG